MLPCPVIEIANPSARNIFPFPGIGIQILFIWIASNIIVGPDLRPMFGMENIRNFRDFPTK